MEPNNSLFNRSLSFLNFWILQVPLLRESRFNGNSPSFRETHIIVIVLGIDKKPEFFEFLYRKFTGFETLHSVELFTCQFIESSIRIHYIDQR